LAQALLCAPRSDVHRHSPVRSVLRREQRLDAESQPTAMGLTSATARVRLQQYGRNALPEQKPRIWLKFLRRFWGAVPWMLEAAFLLEVVLGRHLQAGIIAALLVTNAVISFLQERRAENALAVLNQRLTVTSRVCRDGQWQQIASSELVPGDLVRLRRGDIVAADLRLVSGQLLVDRSSLTGESLPTEVSAEAEVFAGCTVARGEANAIVTTTGSRTRFGKTAELVRTGGAPGHIERVVLSVVRYLVALDVALVAVVAAYAFATRMEARDIVPYCLILLVASVPVALPATFSLSLALGAHELAQRGVLVTRLASIEDIAGMEVLCTDKTGTLTRNELALAGCVPFDGHQREEVVQLAALASDEATQDPIDLAILRASDRPNSSITPAVERLQFIPFDPGTKCSESEVCVDGKPVRVIKGAPRVVAARVKRVPVSFAEAVTSLAEDGQRVLAVASGPQTVLDLIGLVGLRDTPREDSSQTVAALQQSGVRVVMVTGDTLPTAMSIARKVGIHGPGRVLDPGSAASDSSLVGDDVLAGVYPEDKYHLVRGHQADDRVVGMTGDGVNDAPALKQAEVGIAVRDAVDVAKAAASLVLTTAGLSGICVAIDVGRQVFQRMFTYTLNKVVKTIQVSVYLTLGLLWTGQMVVTPRLILLLLFANDFVTMSLSSDNVIASTRPDRWRISALVATAFGIATGWLAFSFGALYVGRNVLLLPLGQLQTFSFVVLVFSGQATVYLAREKRAFWKSLPGRALLTSTFVDLCAIAALAISGVWMSPLSWKIVAGLFGATVVSTLVLDWVKCRVIARQESLGDRTTPTKPNSGR
jgi:H+-transporting ATPase